METFVNCLASLEDHFEYYEIIEGRGCFDLLRLKQVWEGKKHWELRQARKCARQYLASDFKNNCYFLAVTLKQGPG